MVRSIAVWCLTIVCAPSSLGWAQAFRPASAAPDSQAIVREVKGAQRGFETERVARLPYDLEDGRGPCDTRIGRFCYWYNPSDDPAAPEPDMVGQGRMALVFALEDAAARLPGDDWIAGQLVRYLTEHGWPDSAVVAARRCKGTPWWCAALEGLAHHAAQEFAAADSAFARALAGMPREERCAWTDLSSLLADADARRYRRLPCERRAGVNRRIWWLAWPLYSLGANDLRTEHYARLTMARLLRGAASPHNVVFGEDLAELVVRFGWPTRWTRPFSHPGSLETPSALGHEPSPSFWFFADPSLPADTAGSEPRREPAWELTHEQPASRYAPAYATAFTEIGLAQIARFRREGGVLTVAAFDLRRDTLFAGEPTVTLAVARDPGRPPLVGPALFPRSSGALGLRSPWPPRIVSVEARVAKERRAARLRAVVGEPNAWLSDLLLFTPGDESPDSLEDVLPRVVRATEIRRGGRVGLYWETYGEPGSDSITIEVKVVRVGSWRDPVPAVGRTACAPGGHAPVAVRWRDAVSPGAVRARAVTVDFGELDRGRYVVAVGMAADSSAPACASREVRVADR